MPGSAFSFGSDVACAAEAQLSDHATLSLSASGSSNATSGPICTEADAGAGNDVMVASMSALGWPIANPRDPPAAIEAAVSAAEAAIAAVTAAAHSHSVEPGCSEQPLQTLRAAASWGHSSQTLPPIAEDSPLGEQSAQPFTDVPNGQGSATATNSVVPLSPRGPVSIGVDIPQGKVQVDVWIHEWAAQVSELLGYFSCEIARLVERMDKVDQKIAEATERKCAIGTETNIADVGQRSDENCKELASMFTEALNMEREARMYETAQLRVDLNAAGPSNVPSASSAARLAESLAQAASSECDRFTKLAVTEWQQFSEGAASLRTRFSSELTEQHAWAIVDLKEQLSAATRALFAEHDARVCEARDLHARLLKEVTEIAREVAEEILEQQDRGRQCAELRVALQRATLDGVILLSAQSTHSSAIGGCRRRGLSGSSRNTFGQGGAPRTQIEEVAASQAATKTDAIPRGGTSEVSKSEKCGRGPSAEVPNARADGRLVDRHIVVSSTVAGDTACGSSVSGAASDASVASPSSAIITQSLLSSPETLSLAMRADAAVRGDLGVAAETACTGCLRSASVGSSLHVLRGDVGTSHDQEHLHFSSTLGAMQEMQGRRGLSQDIAIDHFKSFCNFVPDRRSDGGSRGASPERKSPTRGCRMLPPQSMVCLPPSQVRIASHLTDIAT